MGLQLYTMALCKLHSLGWRHSLALEHPALFLVSGWMWDWNMGRTTSASSFDFGASSRILVHPIARGAWLGIPAPMTRLRLHACVLHPRQVLGCIFLIFHSHTHSQGPK